uniref:Uncharacterized protein n=1 Tax=Oryza punctata TaxID=4537 RepID=A0A0E0L567_ORYPU
MAHACFRLSFVSYVSSSSKPPSAGGAMDRRNHTGGGKPRQAGKAAAAEAISEVTYTVRSDTRGSDWEQLEILEYTAIAATSLTFPHSRVVRSVKIISVPFLSVT